MKSRAVSLMEVLVVIAIMGAISTGILYIFKNQTTNSQIADGLSQIDLLENATRGFYDAYNCLPGDCPSSIFVGISQTPNSGNMDNIINDWYFTTSAPTAGNAGHEDVNAMQQLIATGFLAGVANADIISSQYISDIGMSNLGKYGLANVTYSTTNGSMITNNLYTSIVNSYYLRGKNPYLYYGVKSVHKNMLNSFTASANATYAVTSAAASTDFITSVVATFVNQSSMIMDAKSYSILAGIDSKTDGDTPLSGINQAVLIGAIQGGQNAASSPTAISFVFMPVKVGATTGAVSVPANTNSTTHYQGITYIAATGTAGTTYSTFGSSWKSLAPATAFNTGAISQTATQSTTNVVVSTDLVRPIWALK